MNAFYVLDADHNPVAIDSRDPEQLLLWGRFHGDIEKRRVAVTVIDPGIEVSTVFLGINHAFFGGPPVLFETMVFGDYEGEDFEQYRYHTWAEAEAGHKACVERIQATIAALQVKSEVEEALLKLRGEKPSC